MAEPAASGTHRDYAPLPSAEMPRFGGIPTFLRLPVYQERKPDVDVLLLGCPLDGGTSFRSGARLGPRAIREASSQSKRFSAALGIDIYDELRVADGGDVLTSPHDLDQALAAIAERAEELSREGIVGGYIGGDQTVTLGALRGVAKAKLKPVGLVHLDSHGNTAPPAWGTNVHHGSAIRCALEERLIRPDQVMQIGVRGPYSSPDEPGYAFARGFEVHDIDAIKWDFYSVVSEVRKMVRQGPIYVSVDVSVLDPAYAPGVSFPCPGGMNTWELQQILRCLVGAKIVGFDVVEVSPPYDHANLTAQIGVAVMHEILAVMADTRRSARPGGTPSSRGGRVSP